MKAIVYTEYGPPEVLQLKESSNPSPGANELLVKVKASSVSAGVLWARTGKHPDSKLFTLIIRLVFGLRRPRKPILGYEFSGTVESTGSAVTKFKAGDRIFGSTTGLKAGAYAEYLCVPEAWKQGVISKIPEKMSFEEAAALPAGGMTALDLLQSASIQPNQKVLIYGASGSVGTYAVQIARSLGAEVTGVCSTSNLELTRSLGAEKVIDYTQEDFSQSGESYDVVFDAVGKISKSECGQILKKKGIYLSVKSPTSEKIEYLKTLKDLFENGNLKPVIDRCYSLEDTAQAHAYADQGHKKGNVIITVA